MARMKIDFLQIGFPRCGTTFLSSSVYPQNPHLECIAPDDELHKLLIYGFIMADGFEYDRQSFEKEFTRLCETAFTNKQAKVRGIRLLDVSFWSERRFDRKNVIDRIYESFPGVKIIMPIRSQRTWIPSYYPLYLREGGLLGLHDFVEATLNNDNLIAHYVDWFPMVSYLYKLFGSEKVLICPLEELQKSPQDMANKIFDFLGVPHVKIDKFPVNPALGSEILPLRRFLNHLVHFDYGASDYNLDYIHDLGKAEPNRLSKFYNTLVYRIYRPYTDNLCFMINHVFGFKGRIRLEERHLKMIEQRYSNNNTRLSKLLDVDLSAFGYP